MEIAALIVLMIFSLAGFAALFFTTFGTLIILIGAILYALMTSFSTINIKVLIILFILYLFGELCEYVFVIAGVKKFGASRAAIVGALLGGSGWSNSGSFLLWPGSYPGNFSGYFSRSVSGRTGRA